jgi:hypothetical protein
MFSDYAKLVKGVLQKRIEVNEMLYLFLTRVSVTNLV